MRINFKVIKLDEPSLKSLIFLSRKLTSSNSKYESKKKSTYPTSIQLVSLRKTKKKNKNKKNFEDEINCKY